MLAADLCFASIAGTALAQMLSDNTVLTDVALAENGVSDTGAPSLRAPVKQLVKQRSAASKAEVSS